MFSRKKEKVTETDKPAKMGRPRFEIDYKKLKDLCGLQCTVTECAVILGCSRETLNDRLRQDYEEAKQEAEAMGTEIPHHLANGWVDFFDKFSALGKVSLRRAQFKNAIEHNNAMMQKWLGVQMLEQKERFDHSSEDGTMTPAKSINEMTIEELKAEARARGLPETIFDN